MTMLKFTILLCLAAVSIAVPLTAAPDPASTTTATKPNIILIVADDLDYADVGDGRKLAPTPNINSIADNGVKFTSSYVTCPVCGPSRVAILTGQYQDRFGFMTNHGPEIPDNFGLPTTVTLVSETLKDAGYATGMVGKWHLGFEPEMTPNGQGFDYFFGHLHGAHDYNAGVEKPGPILRNSTPVKTTRYLTREFGHEASEFIGRQKENPYFLYVPFNAVHGPLQAPKETLEKYASIKDRQLRLMAAMLEELDNAVGQILKAVRDSGEEDNTIIIFTNDNGGVGRNDPDANGILRAGKGTLYEGGIRVPMFMQWKGKLPGGATYESIVSTLDLAPTFIAAAGTTTSEKYDGTNLLPFITGEKKGQPHDILFWHFVDAPSERAVRQGEWKALQMEEGAPWELYNLDNDPGETKNLAAENPDILRKLRQRWNEWNKGNLPPAWLDSRIVNKGKKQDRDE